MSNLTNHNSKIQIICGPTASGKTALALRLAEVSTKAGRPASIISADSRQIYQGLDIITGKDIPKGFVKKENFYEKNNLRLWGLDLLDPDEVYNAADFSALTRKIIFEESRQGRAIFIVGGTGFYLKSLTEPDTLAKIPPNEALRRHLEELSLEKLQQKLRDLDSKRFISMNQSDVNNPRRLIRAIEVASTSIRPISPMGPIRPISFSWLGIRIPLARLRERIQSRVLTRLDRGAVAEVENLLASYPDQTLPVYTTLGVRPIIKFINQEIDFKELVSLWVTDEMNYAKRQITWFKKQPEIVWYDQDRINTLSSPPKLGGETL